MQAATTQIATSSIKTVDPTAAPMITVVLLPSKIGYRKCTMIQNIYCVEMEHIQQNGGIFTQQYSW